MYDVIIIGGGPAGLSAAIYVARSGKKALILEEKAYGGQIINTPNIENYPAVQNISGFEFATNLYEQAMSFGAEIKYEKALKIVDGNTKKVVTSKGEYECNSVILATGAKNRKLGLANEDDLVGRGISYCATCDGMFFRDKEVAVNGGGNTAIEDALFLSNYCKKVYIIHRRDEFRADPLEVEKLKEKDNIELVLDSTISQLNAGEMLESIHVVNKVTNETRIINVQGLFIAIGQEPDNNDFADLVQLEKGYIKANESCVTDTPGIFTAGDCRTKDVRQLATAVSDGAIAGLAAAAYK